MYDHGVVFAKAPMLFRGRSREMAPICPRRALLQVSIVLFICAAAVGCNCCQPDLSSGPVPGPRECQMTLLPEYVIEPPDILLIDALYVVPLPPYKVKSLDALLVRVPKALPDEPISGIFPVDPDGSINLGLSYGAPKV